MCVSLTADCAGAGQTELFQSKLASVGYYLLDFLLSVCLFGSSCFFLWFLTARWIGSLHFKDPFTWFSETHHYLLPEQIPHIEVSFDAKQTGDV